MRLTVQNFRGAKKVELCTADKITLIAGKNRQGKTSTIHALQLLLTGNTPEKTDLRRRTPAGSITLVEGEAYRRIPLGKTSDKAEARGVTPECSTYAAGLADICKIDKKQRPLEFVKILGALPDEHELFDAITSIGFHDDYAIGVAQKVFGRYSNDGGGELEEAGVGWDGALEHYKTKRTKYAGAWEQHTGCKKWGVNVGASWTPEGWSPGADPGELVNTIDRGKEQLEQLLQAGAVSNHVIAELRKQAEKKSQLLQDIQDWQVKVKEYEAQLIVAAEEFKKCPSPNGLIKAHSCPHCAKPVQFSDGNLIKSASEVLTEDQIKHRQQAYTAAKRKGDETKALLDNAIFAHKTANAQAAAAQKAEKELAELESKPQADEQAIAPVREQIAAAERVLKAYGDRRKAEMLHQQIVDLEKVIAVLKPEGLRKQKLADSLKEFNEQLANRCKVAGFPVFELNEDLEPILDDGPYKLASKSEKWMIDSIIRLTVAKIQDAPIVIFDDLDDVLPDHRSGFFGLITGADIAAVIGCATLSQNLLPPMGSLGVAYWVQDGTAEAIK